MSDQDNSTGNTTQPPSYGTFEEFLGSVDEPIKELYKKHTEGLNSALDKERLGRKELEKQMRDLLVKADKGSTLEKELIEKVKLLEESDKKFAEVERRAKFAEEANQPTVRCTNIKAAYALAVTENLFKDNGSPKWEELKKLAPELFKTGGTDAGSNGKPTSNDINAALREAAFGR